MFGSDARAAVRRTGRFAASCSRCWCARSALLPGILLTAILFGLLHLAQYGWIMARMLITLVGSASAGCGTFRARHEPPPSCTPHTISYFVRRDVRAEGKHPARMIETIQWTDDGVVMIDQTRLPLEERYVTCRTYKEVAEAIRTMVIRGAPAIGVAAAMGVALGVGAADAYAISTRSSKRSARHWPPRGRRRSICSGRSIG